MRLLDTTTLELRDFSTSAIPPYAILSHTWSDEEVTFKETFSPSRTTKKGWAKIAKTCELARDDGLGYAWVDTCCIDKSSSAELSEAINSMYQWYSAAALCIVFLEDLPKSGSIEEDLPRCRWFTRGWTLQELLAPKDPSKVKFYDMAWCYRGSKSDLINILTTRTRIPLLVLTGEMKSTDCSVAERMSWAASRETTRPEDIAYCLFGVFEVNMPLLYGEGVKAFRRLQEEIIRISNDLTIFAWKTPQPGGENWGRLFAETPAAFIGSVQIAAYPEDCENFSVTNKGLFVAGESLLTVVSVSLPYTKPITQYMLTLGYSWRDGCGESGGIYLRKLGPKLFARDPTLPLAGLYESTFNHLRNQDITSYYIVTDPTQVDSSWAFRKHALHVPLGNTFALRDVVPEALWDVTDRLFLKSKTYDWIRYPTVMALKFVGVYLGEHIEFVVLCQYQEGDPFPFCRMFWKGSYPREEAMIFQQPKNRQESIYWSQIEIDSPYILPLKNTLERRIGREIITISAHFEMAIVPRVSSTIEIFSLKLDVSHHDSTEV